MTIHAIHHAQLAFPVAEQAAVRHFYGALVGLTELKIPQSETLRFIAGSQRLDLVPHERDARPNAGAHLAFEVQGLPQLRQRLLQAGFALDEKRPLLGHLRFYVQDPAGNQLEFLEPDPTQEPPV